MKKMHIGISRYFWYQEYEYLIDKELKIACCKDVVCWIRDTNVKIKYICRRSSQILNFVWRYENNIVNTVVLRPH